MLDQPSSWLLWLATLGQMIILATQSISIFLWVFPQWITADIFKDKAVLQNGLPKPVIPSDMSRAGIFFPQLRISEIAVKPAIPDYILRLRVAPLPLLKKKHRRKQGCVTKAIFSTIRDFASSPGRNYDKYSKSLTYLNNQLAIQKNWPQRKPRPSRGRFYVTL